MKLAISFGILVGSTVGGWIGDIIGHGWLSGWSLFLSAVGAILGVIGANIIINYYS